MYKRYLLDNGIQVVAENIPYVKSISLGLWFGVGSVYESSDKNGLSHFIEHMMFKGTNTRSSKQIAQEIDAIGGQLNAFTAKECTCYYCEIINDHLDIGIELLSDMVLNSRFDPSDIQKEKSVILEEINMYEDSPEDLVYDLLSKTFFDSHPLGQPILGTEGNINSFDHSKITEYYKLHYIPNNMVVSIAGNFDEAKLIDLLNKFFSKWPTAFCRHISYAQPPIAKQTVFVQKDIEQLHLCIGMPTVNLASEQLYALLIFNNLFGGGMSSRLFQKIREDNGLTYSIFSYPSNYTEAGLFTIYAGMNPSQSKKVVSLIADEIKHVKENGITQSEFEMAKEQLKGNYILGLESTSNRMTAIGRSQILLGKITTPDEVLSKIDKVTMEDVLQIIDYTLNPSSMILALVGRHDVSKELQEVFYDR
mgnify:CR=1 FL=1